LPKAKTVKVYFFLIKNHKLVPVHRLSSVGATNTPEKSLKTALEQLLTKPPQKDLSSAIPAGTKLLNLEIQGDRIYINLSSEFAANGGAVSLVYRVGQIIYTATSLNPKAQVFLSVNGQLLDLLGDIELSQPMTRKKYMAEFTTSFKR
jgi:spore germination protein GerM